MLLHIFVKRLPGGAPAVEDLHYTNDWFEASRIYLSNKIDRYNVEFCVCESDDKTHIINVDTQTHGYEMINNAGFVFERHVSALSLATGEEGAPMVPK